MSSGLNASLADVLAQMLSATSTQQIAAAREAQREWLSSHPEDRLILGTAGEQLTTLERLSSAEQPTERIG